MSQEKKFTNAELANPGQSLSQFVLSYLLTEGFKIELNIDGKPQKGRVCLLEFAENETFAYANVAFDDPISDERFYVRVSIHVDGMVNIMPNQPAAY